MSEDWRQIDGALAGYEVSNLGNVRGPNGLMGRSRSGENSADSVCLRRIDGRQYTMPVRMLVFRAFVDAATKSRTRLVHKDGNPHNRAASNLGLAPKRDKPAREPREIGCLPDERWAEPPGFSSYLVSTEGRVRRKGGPVFSGKQNHNGYRCFNLIQDEGGSKRSVKVHHLVLSAHRGPRPEGALIRHLNDDPADNRLCNLAYGTRQQNTEDAVLNKAKYIASIDWRVVCDVRDALYYGLSTIEELSKRYCVPQKFIVAIACRKIGGDISFLG